MAVHYNTEEEKIERRLTEVISRRAGGFVLCNFSYADDLLFGIDALKSFNIPIYEVYTPLRIGGLKSKLEIKRLKAGHAALKYGCFGGLSFTSIVFYALGHNWDVAPTAQDMLGFGVLLSFLILSFFFASWLIAVKPPRIIRLPSGDSRFLIVVKTKNIMPGEGVASFLQYSGSVEITQAVKKMLLT
jgi:hypothetical protein